VLQGIISLDFNFKMFGALKGEKSKKKSNLMKVREKDTLIETYKC
jgi:hypothetical protein